MDQTNQTDGLPPEEAIAAGGAAPPVIAPVNPPAPEDPPPPEAPPENPPEDPPAVAPDAETPNLPLVQRVRVRADREPTVQVHVNGRSFVCPTGTEVTVPDWVAEALRNANWLED